MAIDFTAERPLAEAVRLSWLGHAMFLLEDGAGNRLLTDPYGEGVGYPLPEVEAGIVLVSHDHFDHGNVALVKGDPVVLKDPGEREVGGIRVQGFPSFHDASEGKERGGNIVYRWEMQGLAFVHLGDLGHYPDAELASRLKGADVLLVPVGGTFTIDDAQAASLVSELSPRIAVPMHYRNSGCSFPILTEEPFVSRFERVQRVGKTPVFLAPGELPDPTLVLVMDYVS